MKKIDNELEKLLVNLHDMTLKDLQKFKDLQKMKDEYTSLVPVELQKQGKKYFFQDKRKK